jgi:hypothetical protein
MTGTKSREKIVSTLSMSLRKTVFDHRMLSYAPLEWRQQRSLAEASMACTNHLFLLIFYIYKKIKSPLNYPRYNKKGRGKR